MRTPIIRFIKANKWFNQAQFTAEVAVWTWLLTHPIQVSQVSRTTDNNMMPIQTSVAARPNNNKTATDSTLSHTTDVELMPPVWVAVNTVNNTSNAMTAWTMVAKKALTRTSKSKHAASTETVKLAHDTQTMGVKKKPNKVLKLTNIK